MVPVPNKYYRNKQAIAAQHLSETIQIDTRCCRNTDQGHLNHIGERRKEEVRLSRKDNASVMLLESHKEG